jgi:hypothetical protein
VRRLPAQLVVAALLATSVFPAARPRPAAAQEPAVPEHRLERPAARFPHDFSQLRGLRELSDGRVLVSDWIEEEVRALDFATGRSVTIGRTGAGPAEFHLPGRLVALAGDSTLLIDEGNGRLAIVGPDLRIHRSVSAHRKGAPWQINPTGADADGRLYFEIPGWAALPAGSPNDSVVVARWHPRTDVMDTVGRVRSYSMVLKERREPGIPYVIFAPQDAWAVVPGGRVVFVRSADYRLEWREADGRRVRGAPNRVRALPVTAADRTEYVRRFVTTSAMGGRGTAGLVHAPAELSSPARIARMVATSDFASERPPFPPGAARATPEGEVWVERSVAAGAPRTFDLFDAGGRLRARVSLPSGRRLLGFGRGTLYAAATDDSGIEILERFLRPSARP